LRILPRNALEWFSQNLLSWEHRRPAGKAFGINATIILNALGGTPALTGLQPFRKQPALAQQDAQFG
jgi:hypothetical protein